MIADLPLILDVEASALEGGYPIEIGIADPGRRGVQAWLIRPHASWAWDRWDAGSQKIHGLRKADLDRDERVQPERASSPHIQGQIDRLIDGSGTCRHFAGGARAEAAAKNYAARLDIVVRTLTSTPSLAKKPISASTEKRSIRPRMMSEMRGCVTPSRFASDACDSPVDRSRSCKSIKSSARIFMCAASSDVFSIASQTLAYARVISFSPVRGLDTDRVRSANPKGSFLRSSSRRHEGYGSPLEIGRRRSPETHRVRRERVSPPRRARRQASASNRPVLIQPAPVGSGTPACALCRRRVLAKHRVTNHGMRRSFPASDNIIMQFFVYLFNSFRGIKP